jgi:predicted lipoprotein with Yx(FWY)xxD motif
MVTRKQTKLRAGGAAAVLVAALIVAGCGSSSNSSSSASSAASAAPSSSPSGSGISVSTTSGSHGNYLTGPSGRALYLWVADSNGKSVCSGACAAAWPPLLTKGAPVAAHGVKASDLSTITRSGGAKQVAYKGHPLYYYVADTSSGQITGQGSDQFGAKWWLVSPAGSAITGAAGSSGGSGGSAGGY